MPDRHQVIPRTLCFIENGDSLLFIQYSEKKGAMKGLYNCPGGHIELSEGIIENAEKEILEETGLEVRNTRLKGVIHIEGFFGKNIMLLVTLSTTHSLETRASEEGTLHWIKKDEVGKINLIEDVRLILAKLETMNEHEVFTAKSLFDGKGGLVRIDFE